MRSEGTLETFRDIFDEICYDLDSNYNLNKHEDGSFSVNKLYITKDEASYKTSNWKLAPGLYEKVNELWRLFQDDNSIRFIKDD